MLSLGLLRNKVLMCQPARRDAHPQAPASPRWLSPRPRGDALPTTPPVTGCTHLKPLFLSVHLAVGISLLLFSLQHPWLAVRYSIRTSK